MSDPNAFAYIMLFAWPVLAALAFRRLPLPVGVAAAIVGGYLLLPTSTEINLPMIPAFDKSLSAVIAALLLVFLDYRARTGPLRPGDAPAPAGMPGWLPRSLWVRACLVGLFGGIFLTAFTNPEPLVYGPTVLPGLGAYDAVSGALNNLLPLLPFFLAWKYLGDPQGQKRLLLVLAVAMALYCLPALYEVRMSPQLNTMIYGFFPHSFLQHMRGDGFRPVVFLSHGLWLSMALALGFLAALACLRVSEARWRPVFFVLAGGLFVTLVLSKSLGALALALLLAPLVLLAGVRVQLLVAAAIAASVMTYPMLRGADIVPVHEVADFAERIDEDRAQSFRFRLDHEDKLLDKAAEKPLLGWGSWGRWRVYDERGEDVTVSDGLWAIALSEGGWLRYASLFGLLGGSLLLAAWRARRLALDPVTGALALLLAANLADLIPNAGLTPITWLLVGAIAGRLDHVAARAPEPQAAAPPPAPRNPYAPVLPPAPAAPTGAGRDTQLPVGPARWAPQTGGAAHRP